MDDLLKTRFPQDLALELRGAESMHKRLNSLHEAYAVILEAMDELWDECRKKRSERYDKDIRRELIQIAAMAWRAARDLGLDV